MRWIIIPFSTKKIEAQRHEISKSEFLNLSMIDIWGQKILCHGSVLCIIGCLIASLAFTHWMLVATRPPPSTAFHNQECLQILTNVSLGKVPQTPKGRVQSPRLVFLAPGFSGHLVHPLQFPSQETDQRGQVIYLWSQWRTRFETTWPG